MAETSADSPRLVEAIVRFDDRTVAIAETSRRVGTETERLGLPRPSYERVRKLVDHLTGIGVRRDRRLSPTGK